MLGGCVFFFWSLTKKKTPTKTAWQWKKVLLSLIFLGLFLDIIRPISKARSQWWDGFESAGINSCFEPLFFVASWEDNSSFRTLGASSTYDHHTSKITWMILREIYIYMYIYICIYICIYIYMIYVSLVNDKMLYVAFVVRLDLYGRWTWEPEEHMIFRLGHFRTRPGGKNWGKQAESEENSQGTWSHYPPRNLT